MAPKLRLEWRKLFQFRQSAPEVLVFLLFLLFGGVRAVRFAFELIRRLARSRIRASFRHCGASDSCQDPGVPKA
jgi:hypothetical protein